MSSKMLAGKKAYEDFMNKEKKKGKSHAEALVLWKEKKSSQPKSKRVSISKKSTPKAKKKRGSGFQRPRGLWPKLTYTPTNKSRVNVEVIKKTYIK